MAAVVVLCSQSRLRAVVRVYFTLGRSPVEANSVGVTICIVWVSLTGCDHLSVNKPGSNGRVSYDSLTHSRLYCRDREKKWVMN